VTRRAREKVVTWSGSRSREPVGLSAPRPIPELVGWSGPITRSDLRALDRELGFATEECNGPA